MAINWPTPALGAGTGTTYTAPAPGSNVWTWSGNAWGSTGTTAQGGFGGPWVVFDYTGKAKPYLTLPEAIADCTGSYFDAGFGYTVPGETIHLFTDTKESVTAANYITLNKSLNINLNGFTYTLDALWNVALDGNCVITNNATEVNVRITNGKIKLINAQPDQGIDLIRETEPVSPTNGCRWYFNNAEFEVESGIGTPGFFFSSVVGGKFVSSSTLEGGGPGLFFYAQPKINTKTNIIRDTVGYSESSVGISFNQGSTGSLSLGINCKGYSNKTNLDPGLSYSGISLVPAQRTSNRYRLVGCYGINTSSSGFNLSYGISASLYPSKLIRCTGESMGGGIYLNRSEAILCTGNGFNLDAGTAFFTLGGSRLRRCSSGSKYNQIGLRSAGLILGGFVGDRAENCSFSGRTYGAYGPGGDSGSYMYLSNCSIRGSVAGVFYNDSGYKVKVLNSTIEPNLYVGGQIDFSPITVGGTGSIICNNVIKGKGGYYYAVEDGYYSGFGTGFVYMAGNTCIDVPGLYLSSSTIGQAMTVSADTKNNIFSQPY